MENKQACYTNPVTGAKMEWENRKMDFKVTDKTGKTNFYLYILAIERKNTKHDRLFRWHTG